MMVMHSAHNERKQETIVSMDFWTSNRSNLCFDFAVLQINVGPVLKRLMADFLKIEQILHHVRNLLFTVYLETTLLKTNVYMHFKN